MAVPPLTSAASLMLPTPPASAKGSGKAAGGDRYPSVNTAGSAYPTPQSPGYGHLYARRTAAGAPEFSGEQPNGAPAGAIGSTPRQPFKISSFIRDGVVVSCGGNPAASSGAPNGAQHTGAFPAGVPSGLHSSVVSLNPAFDTMDSEGIVGFEAYDHSLLTGACKPAPETDAARTKDTSSGSGSYVGQGVRASSGASPTGLSSAPPPPSPLFAGIQVQLGALMEAVAAAKRAKGELDARITQQANELERMHDEQKHAEAGAQDLMGQLQGSRAALAATESRLASTAAELEDTRRALDETSRLLVETRSELEERSDTLQSTRQRLDETAARLDEAIGQLEEAGRALRASADESRRLRHDYEKSQAALAATTASLENLGATTARSWELSLEAYTARNEAHQKVMHCYCDG
ncbi:hypothetical protein GPECTOR_1g762 [Gonium pectorale]|uniref:Uncharacterized protein n=1 Tax=Gonium pectorale TaxID=33097 RepID=A0A150H497_GONPE|nr:hypothetical protein GPECTOR_1g762 [Gonium pectorale]|eukprot:KXZ56845.1 hypothetical protein GPECTOR_1g762 [Gonium pectorale]